MNDKYIFTNEKDLYATIGDNIKYYRKLYSLNKNELTQEKLAEKAGVSTSLIGNLESKKTYQLIHQEQQIFYIMKVLISLRCL